MPTKTILKNRRINYNQSSLETNPSLNMTKNVKEKIKERRKEQEENRIKEENMIYISKMRNYLNKKEKELLKNRKKIPSDFAHNSFSHSLNNELSRVSYNYGKFDNLKKFNKNPETILYFNNLPHYYQYKHVKTKLDKNTHMLKPMYSRDSSFDKLSEKIYSNYKPRNPKMDVRTVRLSYLKNLEIRYGINK
jgi:hypothetical protein